MGHPLQLYLDKHELTERAFAESCKRHGLRVSSNYISQVICGYRYFSRERAIMVCAATGGEVSVGDLMEYQSPRRKRRRRSRAA